MGPGVKNETKADLSGVLNGEVSPENLTNSERN